MDVGYLAHVVSRIGLENEVSDANLVNGEIAYTTDGGTFYVGNNTHNPAKVITDKSKTNHDWSAVPKITLPGGAVADASKPGAIDGVTVKSLNQSNGLLVRRGDNLFGSAVVSSSDSSILVEGGRGSTGTINVRINPESNIVRDLFEGIGTLSIESIEGLEEALALLRQLITNGDNNTITTLRGGASTAYNTLKKIEDALASAIIVVGDEDGVIAQVLAIIRDGVKPGHNTLKKLSDDLDVALADLDAIKDELEGLGFGQENPTILAMLAYQSSIAHQQLDLLDKHNREHGKYVDLTYPQ